jgi:hypothetical protein
VKPYNEYRMRSRIQSPSVCDAVRFAENLYSVGYSALGNNCLDAVYNVLSVYGVTFPPGIDPGDTWCPSGPLGWFTTLPDNKWLTPKPIPARGGRPVVVVSCPTTVASSCVAVPPPLSTGGSSCGGLDFTNCTLCDSTNL